jgi:hypothetical protein
MITSSTPEQVKAFFKSRSKSVLTFTGYSGAGYEEPDVLMRTIEDVLARYDPAATVVNSGGTAEGIGVVYAIAKAKGFETSGIVSMEAARSGAAMSNSVDHLFFIEDQSWGGKFEGSGRLSPTSEAMVSATDIFVAIGGGEIARDELQAAKERGKKIEFIAADMNHQKAIAKSQESNSSAPADFKGAVHEVFEGGER